jgi:hypothetical protein
MRVDVDFYAMPEKGRKNEGPNPENPPKTLDEGTQQRIKSNELEAAVGGESQCE